MAKARAAVPVIETGSLALWHEQLLDAVGHALIVTDMTGTVVYWNRTADHMYGWSAAEALGRNVAELTVPDTGAADAEQIMAQLGAGQSWSGRFEVQRRDGSRFPALVTDTPLHDAEGTLVGIIGASVDLTETDATAATLELEQRRLGMIMRGTKTAMWQIDLETKALEYSANLPSIYGIPDDAPLAIQTDFLAWVHHADRLRLRAALESAQAPGGSHSVEFRIVGADGTVRWMHGRGEYCTTTSGSRGIHGIGIDITEQREEEQLRSRREQAYRRTIEASQDAFVAFDEAGVVTEWNQAAVDMFGWSRSQAIGRDVCELAVPEALRASHIDTFEAAIHRGGGHHRGRVETAARHRDGTEFPIEVSVVVIREGPATSYRTFVRDISERRRLEAQLTRQALTDPLTGLPNRTLLVDRLEGAIRRLARQPGVVGVLFIDADRFKMVNDSFGHKAGDRLLAELATRMRGVLRADDTVARFGGDEFIILCEGIGEETELLALAERVCAAASQEIAFHGRVIRPAVSVGIAVTRSADASAEALISDADAAMYRAKNNGGGRCELFDDTIRARAVARLELEEDLRRALEHDEIRMHYQPVVRLDGRVVGVEALARWAHPTRGMVPPGEFIPVAEDTRLIVSLGAQALRQACAQVADWRRRIPALRRLKVSVNVSGHQLRQTDFCTSVMAILDEVGLPAGALDLEITETVLMDDTPEVTTAVEDLRTLGVTFSLDDFGTGYSSLLYLRRFPVQSLKLDRFFVSGLGREQADDAIVASVIQLAHSLGLRATAEGVETPVQLMKLRQMGCDSAQGYLWAHAMDAAEAEELFRRGRIAPLDPDAAARHAPTQPAAIRARAAASPRHRVMLVDDSAGSRSLVRLLLEDAGPFDVVAEADSGEEALGLMPQHHPDLVVLDLSMPGMDGLETLRALLALAPRTKVVVLSGFISPALAVAARAEGAQGCFDKDLPPERLAAELEMIMREGVARPSARHPLADTAPAL